MLRAFTTIATAAILVGCAARVTSTSPRSITINAGILQAQGAQDLATEECAKHGRHARMSARPGPGNRGNGPSTACPETGRL